MYEYVRKLSKRNTGRSSELHNYAVNAVILFRDIIKLWQLLDEGEHNQVHLRCLVVKPECLPLTMEGLGDI